MSQGPAQRLRFTFTKEKSIRWISHLDLVRLWERVLRRTGLPVAYTHGYNPQMRIQFASALPTGCYSRFEVADVWMEERVKPEEFAQRVHPQLPSGVKFLGVREVDLRLPSLQSLLRAADWRVAVEAPDIPWETLQQRVDEILEAEQLLQARRRRQGQPSRTYDLRPLIESLRLEGRDEDGWPVFWMRLRAEPGATGRPDEVLGALDLRDRPSRMERLALHFASAEAEEAETTAETPH